MEVFLYFQPFPHSRYFVYPYIVLFGDILISGDNLPDLLLMQREYFDKSIFP
ncbi:hypothetical protein MmTuc01_3194 [Methanosarcina mazei Tuc01]|uniref:Uncharacterized protein n=1 Tax=Methanosarcina mazei Tuc01 TaxID=1236903 RepID=M1Q1N3_METMZ|nr:hypothetical protein MmTuc01_3194 [Methanosarcina mazei Tuc01]